MKRKAKKPANLAEYEAHARKVLPKMNYDYFAGGANDEITLCNNHTAFERLQLLPRVLVDVSKRDLSTTILGEPIRFPVLVAPTAFQKLAHKEGEAATAAAAGASGTIMILSSLANCTLEEVARAASGPLWFQLYVFSDREATKELVQRAESAGYRALVLTVDTPQLGRRERDIRNRFTLPPGLGIPNLKAANRLKLSNDKKNSRLGTYFSEFLDPSLTWSDVEWLQSITDLPIILKGIHRPDDARLALEHGVAGIVVSNHGARQLDTVPATIDMLPAIVEAVGDCLEILMDGGVRRGTDVVKALALGARAVLLGRPIIWGLACDGEQGVHRVLELLHNELDLALALCGSPSVASLDKNLVIRNAKF